MGGSKTLLPEDPWRAFKHQQGPDEYRWLAELEAWCEEQGEDVKVALAREALKQRTASDHVVEMLEHQRNTIARLSRELRAARTGAAA
jgi:hypothetical protein